MSLAGSTPLPSPSQFSPLLYPDGRPQRLLTSYASVTPILARQFCQLQVLGMQHTRVTLSPRALLAAPVHTPLVAAAWHRALADHPDRRWVDFLLRGMQQGFRIGLRAQPTCRPSHGNSPSAIKQCEVISSFLEDQVHKGYMIGPLQPASHPGVVTSRMAVVPKKTPGKFRVIIDLSSPDGHSVNDHIHRELTHVAYSSIDDAALLMHHLGPHALMAKLDIKDAYRMVPVHPEDRHFLGVSWQGQLFIDCQLPFGLASSPAIFNSVAEALEWILRKRGVNHIIHYLDDFLILGAPGEGECERALRTAIQTCEELGVPLATDKIEGPSTRLSFLGIELDSASMTLQLPQSKLLELRRLLHGWSKAKCIKDFHSFQSLVGHLVHATNVVPLAKAYLNSLFPLAQVVGTGRIRRLNKEARRDIGWWLGLCDNWPGISVHQFLLLQDPAHHLFTDASGSWGCGAWSLPYWFCFPWLESIKLHSIALKELFPIVLACATWGSMWRGTYVLCHSDNVAAVAQVNRLHARDPLASHLLRCLAIFQFAFDFRIRATHIRGSLNIGADDLSRGRPSSFLIAHPSALPLSTQVDPRIVELLLNDNLDWTSNHWKQQFNSIWQ